MVNGVKNVAGSKKPESYSEMPGYYRKALVFLRVHIGTNERC